MHEKNMVKNTTCGAARERTKRTIEKYNKRICPHKWAKPAGLPAQTSTGLPAKTFVADKAGLSAGQSKALLSSFPLPLPPLR